MEKAALAYQQAINDGIKPEDARFLLPESTKTNLTCGMNLREFFNFLDLRLDPHAQ
jgi:thymidylate synthase (FAD)